MSCRSGFVEVTILMSLSTFDGLVDRCDKDSREFAVLKNGVIIQKFEEDHFDRLVEIRCNLVDADRLLFSATTVYPGAADDIAKAIAAARQINNSRIPDYHPSPPYRFFHPSSHRPTKHRT